jgi:hypothetical protein
MTVPAMAPIETLPLLAVFVVDSDEAELVVLEDAVLDLDVVDVGNALVEEGDEESRQLLSSEIPTIFTSELPPWRPCESVIAKIIEVPGATLAVHVNEVGPVGGLRTNGVPEGIIP